MPKCQLERLDCSRMMAWMKLSSLVYCLRKSLVESGCGFVVRGLLLYTFKVTDNLDLDIFEGINDLDFYVLKMLNYFDFAA